AVCDIRRIYKSSPGAGSKRSPPKIQCHHSHGVPLGTCGKLGQLGTSQDFLVSVTFRASGGVASFAFLQSASHTRSLSASTAENALLGPGRRWPGFLFFLFFPGLWQMTARIISTLAVAITIGPSLAYGSPACMTQSEARAKFPKATHLYMRKNCWSDSATNTVQARSAAAMPPHSPRPAPRAVVPTPSPRRSLAAVPTPSPRPEPAGNGIDPGTQCRLSPCE